ncbi:zinc finger protein 638 isoform X2 [Xenopus laevis]|uniref:Zinc finger protein 638 isoform X2 n=1 Tax=Xenopus laevis TaxID=8355 RepID=A0A8J1MMA1_XENLA|nr:zinc finger protein 638 isoform X2 [Xenopus laevis]
MKSHNEGTGGKECVVQRNGVNGQSKSPLDPSFVLFLENCAPIVNTLNLGISSPVLLSPHLQLAQIKTQLALHHLTSVASSNTAPIYALLNQALLKISTACTMFNPRGGFPVQRQQQPGHPLLNQPNMNHPGMNLTGLNHPGMNLPNMNNPSLTHPGMAPSGMNHPGMGHSGINQPGMNFNRMAHPGMNQGGMNQGGMNQGGMNQGGMNQGGMNQGGMNQGGMNQGGINPGGMNQGGMNQGDMGFHCEIKGPGFAIRPHGMDPPGPFLRGAPEPMGMKGMPLRAPMHGTPERPLGPQAFQQQRFGGPSPVRPGPQRMQSHNSDVAPGMNLLMKQSPSDLLLGKDIPLHEPSRHVGNEKQWEPRGTFGHIPQPTGMKPVPSSQISDHQNRYTTESASSILESFGLSNEDLEELSRYPDDQLTPANMPVILRDIRMRKISQPVAPDQSGGRRPASDGLPSKVIDYGHSSKYPFKEDSVPVRTFDSRKKGKNFKPAAAPKKMGSPKFNLPASSVKKQPDKPSSNLMDNKIPTISVTRQNQRPSKQERPQSTNIVVEQPVMQSAIKSEVPRVEHPPVMTANQPEVPAIGHSDTQVASYTEARADHIPTLVSRGNYQPPSETPGDAARFQPKWSPGLSLAETEKMKRLPTPSMMNDYYAASPRIFPHICSLCNLQCRVLKDWIKHQNTEAHIESCRQLRLRHPDWNPHELAPLRDDKDKGDASSKRSKSSSNSPRRSRRSGSGHRARRSRSRSPRLSGRVRTRSRSPKRPVRSPRRSRSPRRRSRSPRRSLSPRRTRRPRSSRSVSTSPDKRAVDAAVRDFIDKTGQKTVHTKNKLAKAPSNGKRPLQRSSSNSSKTKKQPSSSAKNPGSSSSVSKKPSSVSSISDSKKSTSSSSSSHGSSSSAAKKPVVSTAAKKTSSSALTGKKPSQSKYSGAAKNSKGSTKPPPAKEPYTPLLKFKNKSNPGTMIHVTNLPDSGYTDQDILKIVQPFGKVCDILIIRSKNEAFLETNFKEAAAAAVKFSETTPVMINNTRINLCLAGQKVECEKKDVTPASVAKTPVKTTTPPVNTAKAEAKTTKAEAKTTPKLDPKKGSANTKAARKAKVPDVIPPGFVKRYKLTEPPMKDAEKCVVLISNLPEGPMTVEELSNLAKPFGGVNDIIIISTHRKALLELSSKNSVDSMIKFYDVFPSNMGGNVLSISLASKFKDLKDEERIFAYLIEQSPCKITPSVYEEFVYLVDLPEKGYTESSVVCVGLRFGKVDHYAIFSNKRKAILHMCSASAAKAMHSFLTQYPCTIGENTVKSVLPSKKQLSEDEYEVVVEEEKACSETESNVDETEEAQTADEMALKTLASNADSAAHNTFISTSIPVVAVIEPVVTCLEEQSSAIEEESLTVVEQPSAVDEEAPAIMEEAPAIMEEAPAIMEEAPVNMEEAQIPNEEATRLTNEEETGLASKEDMTLTNKEETFLTDKEETDQVEKEANEEEIYTIPKEETPTFEKETDLAIYESEIQQGVQDASEAKLEKLSTSKNPGSFEEAVARPESARTFTGSTFLSLGFGIQATEDDDEEEEAAEAPDLDVTSPISSTATDPMEGDGQPEIQAKPHIAEDFDVMVSVESECEEEEMSEQVSLRDHVQVFHEPEANMVKLFTASEETEEPETDDAAVAPEIFSDSPSHITTTQNEPSEVHAKISETCGTHEFESQETSLKSSKGDHSHGRGKDSSVEKSSSSKQTSTSRVKSASEKSRDSSTDTKESLDKRNSGRTTKYNPQKGELSVTLTLDSQKGSKLDTRKKPSADRGSTGRESSTPKSNSNRSSPSESSNNLKSSAGSSQKKGGSRNVSSGSDKESKFTQRSWERETRSSNKKDNRFRDDRSKEDRPRDDRSKEERPRDDRSKEDRPRADRFKEDRPLDDRSKEERPRDDRSKEDRPRDDRSKEDRPRDEHSKEDRPRDDRSKEDRPRDDLSKEDRPRDDLSKENRPRDDRSKEDRPRDDRSKEDRPRDDRSKEDRPRDDRSKEDRPRDDRSKEDRPRDDRSKEDRPRDDRSKEDRPRDDRSKEDRPRDERSKEDRPRDERSKEDRPRDERSKEDRPRDERSKEDRPRDDRSKEERTRDDRAREDRFKSSLTKQQRSSRSASHGKKSEKEQEDEFPFNLDEFVTVDEIVEEHGDAKKAEEQTDATYGINASRKGKRKDNEPSPLEAKKAKGRSPDPHVTKQDLSYVTLDEIVDEEDGTVGPQSNDSLGLAKESKSLLTVDEVHAEVDQPSAKVPQGLMTLDEISEEEDGTRDSATTRAPLETPEDFVKEQLLTLDEVGGEEEEPITSESLSLQATNPKDEENKAELNDLDDKEIDLSKILEDPQVEDQVTVDPKEQPLLTLDEVKGDDDTESIVDISFSEGNQFVTVDEIGEEEEDSTFVSEVNIESGGKAKGKSASKVTNPKPTPKRGRPRKRTLPKDSPTGPSDSSKNKKDKKETQDSTDDPSSTASWGTDATKSPVESKAKASKESPGKGKNTAGSGPEKADSEKAAASAGESKETASETKRPKLAPYNPSVPIGMEFLIPQTGFFCELCSLFYINEPTKIKHCKSLRHYQSVEKHMAKAEESTDAKQ